jgi:hypothetical protein
MCRVGSAFGDESCHLADEVLEIAEGLEPVGDDVVVDPDVLVDEDVAEADRLADGARECRGADAVLATIRTSSTTGYLALAVTAAANSR